MNSCNRLIKGIVGAFMLVASGLQSSAVHASWGAGLSIGYNWGNQNYNPYIGQQLCGYGMPCSSAMYASPCAIAAAAGQACAAQGGYGNTGFGGGAFGGGLGSLPPPPTFIPPHAQSGLGGGLGYGMGQQQGGYYPPVMSPMASQMPYSMQTPQYYNMGPTILDMRNRNEWEKDDAGSIVFSAGIGMGLQTTNVFPVIPPRSCGPCTSIPPTWYNQGDRDIGFHPRPTH